MGLFAGESPRPSNTSRTIAAVGQCTPTHYGLIDSGAAVTAVGKDFAPQLPIQASKQMGDLTSVTGKVIQKYGSQVVPCHIMDSEGNLERATLKPEVLDVEKPIISVLALVDHKFGTLFPPEAGEQCLWVCGNNGSYIGITCP